MDELGIPGFGTELLRVDFLPDVANVPAWPSSGPVFARLARILDRDAALQTEWFDRCLGHASALRRWSKAQPENSPLPWIENEFLSPLDMVALYGMIRETRPDSYVEIGCGISTRVALAAVTDGQLATRMICVDPVPRIVLPESDIVHLQKKLETAVDEVLALAQPGSILFFDGSHRSFPGSDVTLFFMELLPALAPGVIVHIHDIFLPADYPAYTASRYWSEQYLLAAWLLGGGHGFEILLPGAHLAAQSKIAEKIPGDLLSTVRTAAGFSSFWLRTR
jgi:Methyltransferase domain